MTFSSLSKHVSYGAALVLCYALVAGDAQAYIGPGAGLSAIGSLFALVAAVCVTIVGFVWYPIKRLFRRKKPAAPAQTPLVTEEGDKQSAAE